MSKTEKNISIQEAISELLFQHDCVILPKFGGFVKEYRAASFDYVQGKISPPSSTIIFNENLIVDDGLLLDFYKSENSISLTEAKEDVEKFVASAKITLSNKEVVSLPKVGRLLNDYENQTKFISENFNFNTDTFGLPDVRYYPILRDMPMETTSVSDDIAKVEIPKPISKKRRSQTIAKIAIPIFLCLVLFTAYSYYSSFNDENGIAEENIESDASKLPVKNNINKSPAEEEIDYNPDSEVDIQTTDSDDASDLSNPDFETAEIISSEEEDSQDLVEEETDIQDIVENTNPIDSETFEVIFVGMFGKQHGVDLTTAMIVENNWVPYTELSSKGLTRVGIKVPNGEDALDILSLAQQKISANAFIRERSSQ